MGSEMCIRDRATCLCGFRRHDHQMDFVGGVGPHRDRMLRVAAGKVPVVRRTSVRQRWRQLPPACLRAGGAITLCIVEGQPLSKVVGADAVASRFVVKLMRPAGSTVATTGPSTLRKSRLLWRQTSIEPVRETLYYSPVFLASANAAICSTSK